MNYETGKYWDKALSCVDGCMPCSPGCDNCWSRALGKRFGKWPDIVTFREDRLNIPLKTKKSTVFSIWNDLFHENVSDAQIEKAFHIMGITQRHTYFVLTKRSKRMAEFVNHPSRKYFTLDNVWCGVTICNQKEADEKIPDLWKVTGYKWLSIEPCLEGLNLFGLIASVNNLGGNMQLTFDSLHRLCIKEPPIRWVVVGAETGTYRRPCNIEWIRSIVLQCKMANVPVWVKGIYLGKKISHDMQEWPEDLRVRETPWWNDNINVWNIKKIREYV